MRAYAVIIPALLIILAGFLASLVIDSDSSSTPITGFTVYQEPTADFGFDEYNNPSYRSENPYEQVLDKYATG